MIKIISDSACDLPMQLVEKFNIRVVPYHVLLGNEDYLDGVSVTPDEIFAYAGKNKVLPKTAAPSVFELSQVFSEELGESNELICFTIASNMSTTYNSMHIAAQDLNAEGRISIINSENLAMGQGMLAIEASRMASEGKSRKEIVETIEALKPSVKVSFVVDSLRYLYLGGRCNAIEAFAGSTLKLHPMIEVFESNMRAVRKYRGNTDRCIEKYANDLEPALKEAVNDYVIVEASMPEDTPVVRDTIEKVKQLGIFKEVYYSRAGAVISSHCGPNSLGILFMEKKV